MKRDEICNMIIVVGLLYFGIEWIWYRIFRCFETPFSRSRHEIQQPLCCQDEQRSGPVGQDGRQLQHLLSQLQVPLISLCCILICCALMHLTLSLSQEQTLNFKSSVRYVRCESWQVVAFYWFSDLQIYHFFHLVFLPSPARECAASRATGLPRAKDSLLSIDIWSTYFCTI